MTNYHKPDPKKNTLKAAIIDRNGKVHFIHIQKRVGESTDAFYARLMRTSVEVMHRIRQEDGKNNGGHGKEAHD